MAQFEQSFRWPHWAGSVDTIAEAAAEARDAMADASGSDDPLDAPSVSISLKFKRGDAISVGDPSELSEAVDM